MPSPFPGMDPYLEIPELWPNFHHLLISEIAKALSPQLRPKYRVVVEVRMYETTDENSLLVGIPDITIKRQQAASKPSNHQVAVLSSPKPISVRLPLPITIKEGYLEIRKVGTGEVITAIEVLSPTNKRKGKGRDAYLEKREQVLGSLTNLVEIDLLRDGERMPVEGENIEANYWILVSRSKTRPRAELYALHLADVIPSLAIPLRSPDIEPILDLQRLLNEVYDVSGYDLDIDYNQEPEMPLSEVDAAWVDSWLREKGLRKS